MGSAIDLGLRGKRRETGSCTRLVCVLVRQRAGAGARVYVLVRVCERENQVFSWPTGSLAFLTHGPALTTNRDIPLTPGLLSFCLQIWKRERFLGGNWRLNFHRSVREIQGFPFLRGAGEGGRKKRATNILPDLLLCLKQLPSSRGTFFLFFLFSLKMQYACEMPSLSK